MIWESVCRFALLRELSPGSISVNSLNWNYNLVLPNRFTYKCTAIISCVTHTFSSRINMLRKLYIMLHLDTLADGATIVFLVNSDIPLTYRQLA